MAVKKLIEGSNSSPEGLLHEGELLAQLQHLNIVQLLGVCSLRPPYYLITEFMVKEDLLTYLQLDKGEMVKDKDIVYMAKQVLQITFSLKNLYSSTTQDF